MSSIVKGTYNFRQAANGIETVKNGILYRSDAFDAVDDTVARQLIDMGISTVIDLRTPDEIRAHPNNLHADGLTMVQIPLFGATPELLASGGGGLTLDDVYRFIIDESGSMIANVIYAIATTQGGVIVHCTAGKDRTGIVIALTLAAIGLDDEIIVDDYAITQTNLVGEWSDTIMEKMTTGGITIDESLKSLIYSSPPESLRSLFAYLCKTYGSIDAYLDTIGIDNDVRGKLKEKLLSQKSTET